MNQLTLTEAEAPHDIKRRTDADMRRATALADIQQMRDDLTAAYTLIEQLRADLHRAEDRLVLCAEERAKYRAESLMFRSKLIELATAMANIGLLTVTAQDVMATVRELSEKADLEATKKEPTQ